MTIREILFENENENKKTSGVIFLNDRTAIVGITHGQKLELSPDTANKVKAIAAEYGAWYEGNGMDKPYTKGIIDEYRGSWEDDLLNKSIKGYPYEFLFVLFANIKENDTIRGKIGFDPSVTIFDRILKTQRSINYFVDRTFTADTLTQFLEAVSDEKHDFIEMSKKPATEKNVTEFFELGSALSWPSNWDQYPYNAGKVAERANLVRDEFLASRKSGVYVTGGGHLIAISKLSKKQPVDEGKPRGGLTKWFREKPMLESTPKVTFAGKDPNSFQSPKGGKPVMVIVTGQGSRYLITDDGMVLRNKSFHANTGGEDQGLQPWSDKIEFYDRSTPLVSGALHDMAFPDAVLFLFDKGRVALSKTPQGDRIAMILDNGNWRPATIGDAVPKAVKEKPEWANVVIKANAGSWASTPKVGWQPLDYNLRPDGTLKRVHNGSPVTHGATLNERVTESKPRGGLTKWFKEKWVNIAKKKGGKHPPCGTSGETSGYAKCVPAKKAASMSAKEKKSAVNRKRSAQRKAGRPGRESGGTGKAPIRVKTDK